MKLHRLNFPVAAVVALAATAVLAATVAAEEAPPTKAPATLAAGVSVDGLPVEGLTISQARAKLLAERIAPRRQRLVVGFNRTRFPVRPANLGYRADIDYALQVAKLYGAKRPVPEGGVNITLRQRLNKKKLRAFMKAKAAKGVISPRDAGLKISNTGFTPIKARIGSGLNIKKAEAKLTRLILQLDRPGGVTKLPTKRLKPKKTSAGAGVLVNRNTFKLTFFKNGKTRAFPIAVGAVGFSTPAGRWSVTNKQRNPWWTPPPSPWAAGSKPVPPGPGNPLGTRWMGLNATFIGIHGTPSSGSLGSRASHGCIRMQINDAEWLYDKVELGTPVVIV